MDEVSTHQHSQCNHYQHSHLAKDYHKAQATMVHAAGKKAAVAKDTMNLADRKMNFAD